MGNISSRSEDASQLLLRDQSRLAITSVKITNARGRVLYTIAPNAYPATRFTVKRDPDDDTPVEYIQDPDTTTNSAPNFLLRLSNEDDIFFYFTFVMRQGQTPSSTSADQSTSIDTIINSLTFLFASTPRELDTLVTREFNADPNLHKNPNVDLVGDYSTAGSAIEQFEWSWKWRPPKQEKDKGGGWRTSCSFAEYDQRGHKLSNLVSFSFWVNSTRTLSSPKTPSRFLEPTAAPRIRVPSAQSVESRFSDSDTEMNTYREPPSPNLEPTIPEHVLPFEHGQSCNAIKVDISYQRPGEDVSAHDDGPVFRATMKALEQKTGNMRVRMKQVLRKAEAARDSQIQCNRSVIAFMEALRYASHSNANAVQPALDHYFEKIATEILAYERQNTEHLQKLIIDPLARFYSNEIKQVDAKKKDFDEESKDYYAYVSKYLGQRQDSLKEKKRVESDSKYQAKRKNFELKRFDYSAFMQDLHGGRKDQEVLSQLTQYADTQAKGYLATARKIEAMMPQLEALVSEVREADKEYQLIRTGREEKRRTLEKGAKSSEKTDILGFPNGNGGFSDAELASLNAPFGNAPTVDKRMSGAPIAASMGMGSQANSDLFTTTTVSPRSNVGSIGTASSQNKFKGYRDLEDRDTSNEPSTHRREGLLWSWSRGNHYVDPKGLNKQAWHKFWIVLDQGRLSEYVNWKETLEQNREPIDLRVASVREARNAERRFCFEVITPNYTRIYQAPSEDEMRAWISAINNALQSAFESKSPLASSTSSSSQGHKSQSIGRDLFGKASSFHGHRTTSSSSTNATHLSAKNVGRHATVGNDRPVLSRSRSSEDGSSRLLQTIRDADAGNVWCADCGSESRVEWVSINLGIIVCIECSGIHRSLGTHITKIRSLTLDVTSFTQDIVEILLKIGNRVSNMIYEATLDRSAGLKPSAHSSRDRRLRFITAKYAQKAYVAPHATSPNDLLLSAIKTQNLQNVIHALALSGNVNATDKVRATPAFYLALAAADPAAPGASLGAPSPSAKRSASPGPNNQRPENARTSFPIAELLAQNGAEVPLGNPPIPLGSDAWLYLEFKRAARGGRAVTPNVYGTAHGSHPPSSFVAPTSTSAPSTQAAIPIRGSSLSSGAGQAGSAAIDGHGDTLTALPVFEGLAPGHTGNSSGLSPSAGPRRSFGRVISGGRPE